MIEDKNIAFSQALVALFKGVLIRETHTKQWETVLNQRAKIEEYISKIGLVLYFDDDDGYCYLKQRPYQDDGTDIPRLISRHQLSYPISTLLCQLRKQLLDFDSKNSESRLIASKEELIDKMRLFLPNTSNEAKQIKDIEGYIKRVEDMGFIKQLKGSDEKYEVLRIIRSFIDGEWLNTLDQRLKDYKTHTQSNFEQNETEITIL